MSKSSVPGVEIASEIKRIGTLIAERVQSTEGLDVQPVVRAGRPGSVVRDFCRADDLLVLGQHSYGRFRPPTIGPVIADLLHNTDCAVAIVREPASEQPPTIDARTADADRPAGDASLPSPGLLTY